MADFSNDEMELQTKKTKIFSNFRNRQYREFQRVLKYAKDSALLPALSTNDDPTSPLLQWGDSKVCSSDDIAWFEMDRFRKLFFRFDEFLDQCFERRLDIMISGSSVFHTVYQKWKGSYSRWHPNDVDIYLLDSADQTQTILDLESVIRSLYKDKHIYIVRTPYMLTWYVVKDSTSNEYNRETCIVSFQLVLSPCKRWEHVFAGYHADVVCSGYLAKHKRFVCSERFIHWYKGYVDFYSVYDAQTHYENLGTHRFPCLEPSEQKLESLGTYVCFFFPDLVSPRYRDRVYNAYEKYLQMRGVMSNYVEPFEDLYIPDIERSGNLYSVEKLVSRGPKSEAGVDATVFLKTLPDGVLSVGSFVSDVYNGESFSSILETMSCFQKCPGVCGNFVLCLRESFNKGAFCDACFQKEEEKRDLITKRLRVLGQLKSKALITGGRCGLGKEVLFQLAQCGLKCYTTTRFPSKFEADEYLSITPLSLDLKDPSFGDWPEVIKLLESGDIHYLILSASETLHFEKDDSLKNNKSEIEEKGLDWTNDMIRENSGIWHKTLDQHSFNEIISPLLANVGGSSALLSAFLRGVKKARNLEQIQSIPAERQRDYMCVVVTSFEGAFLPKTPFHPITNACKSALEQIVWTIQSQAKVLNCPVLLSDPGWVYTESSFGKVKGPVPISCGTLRSNFRL